jgi:nucleoside-diphosphate-sugar epimerase
VLRHGVQAAWRLRLTPTDRGWVDLALGLPLMDTTRARTELGWVPHHSSIAALDDLLEGMREGMGMPTAPLHAS